MNYNTLLQQFPGYQGWGQPEALADYAQTGGSGKGGGGSSGGYGTSNYMGGIDMNQVPSVQDYIQGQFASEDPYLQALLARMSGQEKPLDIFSRLETEAGLPEMRKTASTLSKEIANVEDYLDIVEPTITGRTRESLVTQAQKTGMVQEEKKPYLEKLSKFGTSLGRLQSGISSAEGNIGTKVGLAVQGQQQELEPLKFAYQTMVDRNARKTTGFTADRQTLLDSLYDKLNRTRQLSDMEWQQANQLASEERQYVKTLQSAAAQAGAKITGNESIDELLGLIGTQAASQIAWERRKTGSGTGGYTTQQKQAYASEIAKFFATEGSRGEAVESAASMILQGYPPDIVYDELERQFPSPKEYAPEKTTEYTEEDLIKDVDSYSDTLVNQGVGETERQELLKNYIINKGGDPRNFGIVMPTGWNL